MKEDTIALHDIMLTKANPHSGADWKFYLKFEQGEIKHMLIEAPDTDDYADKLILFAGFFKNVSVDSLCDESFIQQINKHLFTGDPLLQKFTGLLCDDILVAFYKKYFG